MMVEPPQVRPIQGFVFLPLSSGLCLRGFLRRRRRLTMAALQVLDERTELL
jgi:hypothetical protein